jgi:hypothetical protein
MRAVAALVDRQLVAQPEALAELVAAVTAEIKQILLLHKTAQRILAVGAAVVDMIPRDMPAAPAAPVLLF